MKILSVIESLAHGGAETVLLDLVLGLDEHTHRVLHFSRARGVTPHAPFLDALAAAQVPCLDARWRLLDDPQGWRGAFTGFDPDVVLIHWWGNDSWLPWIRTAPRLRAFERPAFVCILHHAGVKARDGFDCYVRVAPNQSAQLTHLSAGRMRHIPNGVDLRRFPATAATERESRDRDAGRPMVVGRLSSLRRGKIPRDWVRTLVSFNLPDTRFVIAGDGEMRSALLADATALDGDGRFVFPGYISRAEVPAVLRGFDVFCYATAEAEECHPLALLEALAAGVPIVAEARGGLPSIVRHEENGLLAASTAEIGVHLHRLRADPVLRNRLAAGARADARSFSLDVQLARYRLLLAELTAGQREAISRAP